MAVPPFVLSVPYLMSPTTPQRITTVKPAVIPFAVEPVNMASVPPAADDQSSNGATKNGQSPYPDSRAVVAGRKVFSCSVDDCHYKTYRPHHLKRHILTHTGEKPFQCNMCDVKCARADALIQHRKTHVPDHPFMCPHCTVELSDDSQLQDHLKSHIHCCQTCGDSFSTLKRLRDHERKHARFTCRFCGLSSIHVKKVERHERSTHGATISGATKVTFPMDLRKGTTTTKTKAKRKPKRIQSTKMTQPMSETLIPPGIVDTNQTPIDVNLKAELKTLSSPGQKRPSSPDSDFSSGYESDRSRTSISSNTTMGDGILSFVVNTQPAPIQVLDLSGKVKKARSSVAPPAFTAPDVLNLSSSAISRPLDLSPRVIQRRSTDYQANEAYNLSTIQTFIARCANEGAARNANF